MKNQAGRRRCSEGWRTIGDVLIYKQQSQTSNFDTHSCSLLGSYPRSSKAFNLMFLHGRWTEHCKQGFCQPSRLGRPRNLKQPPRCRSLKDEESTGFAGAHIHKVLKFANKIRTLFPRDYGRADYGCFIICHPCLNIRYSGKLGGRPCSCSGCSIAFSATLCFRLSMRCLSVHVCMSVCLSVCMYVCTSFCTYLCICVRAHPYGYAS